MRGLEPEEIAERLAAGRARVERTAEPSTRRPARSELREAIKRAEAALHLVITDVRGATDVRERGEILRSVIGSSFALDGDQSIAEIAVDIVFQIRDDVTHEVWAAWPKCPAHEHPISAAVIEAAALSKCPADAA